MSNPNCPECAEIAAMPEHVRGPCTTCPSPSGNDDADLVSLTTDFALKAAKFLPMSPERLTQEIGRILWPGPSGSDDGPQVETESGTPVGITSVEAFMATMPDDGP